MEPRQRKKSRLLATEERKHDIKQCAVCCEQKSVAVMLEAHAVATGEGLAWTTPCVWCGANTLHLNANVGEAPGPCCNKGKTLEALRNWRPQVLQWAPESVFAFYRDDPVVRKSARNLNSLFTISSIGTTGGFKSFTPGGMSLSGRTFHLLRNSTEDTNPLWCVFFVVVVLLLLSHRRG